MNTAIKPTLTSAAITFLLMTSSSANAFEPIFGAKAGTLGYGMDVSIPVSEKVSLRGGFTQFSFDYDDSISSTSSGTGGSVTNEATYKTTLDLNAVNILADYHPFTSGFRITGGAMLNSSELTAVATAGDQTISIGDYQSTSGADLTADVEVTFPSTAPYLGLGYDSSPYSKSGLSFSFDAGVMFQGEPTASVKLSGADANQVSQDDIDKEVADINDTLSDFTVYPVINMGLSYRF